jgi:outer membrane protein OmpA-like peptidoglycan-associated protein
MKKLLYLILILFSVSVFAQVDEGVKKADELYSGYEYIKARDIYLKVAKRGYVSGYLYKKLGDSYFKTAEYKEAVKWYEKLFKLGEDPEPEYYFRFAQCLKASGRRDEGDKYLQKYYSLVDDKFRANNIKKKSYILYDNDIPLEYSSYKIDSLAINTKFSDFAPIINNKKLYFASAGYHPVGYKKKWQNGQPYFDLYKADINAPNDVTGVRPLSGDINTEFHESSATFSPDGKTMYFSRNSIKSGDDKNKNLSKLKIYRAEKIDGKWKTIEELPFNSENFTYTHPALSPDGKRLYFVSDMPGSFGSSDIWYVEIYDDNSYSYPQNLGPKVNTTERENFPFITKDKIYFASDGQLGYGGLDIFVADLDENGMVGDILNLGKPINTPQDDFSFTIDTENNYGYFASSRNNAEMRDNIYVFYKSNEIKKGDVKDLFSKMQDTIKVAIPKEDVIVEGTDLGKILKLSPIYFEYGKSDIGPRAAIELEKVITVLRKYPRVKLDIRSHTDSRSSAAFNLKLSEKRAQATKQYIIDSGIDPSRITAKGYGETQLVNKCKDGVKCTEMEHRQNRRSEFIIIDDAK